MSHQELLSLTTGSALSELDIFLSANGTAINANSVVFTIFDATNTVVTSGVAANPTTGQYTATGTVPAGFALGIWSIGFRVFPVGAINFNAVEEFNVNDITLSFGFTPSTDQTHSVFDAVRIDLGDPDANILHDAFLSRVLTKAVRRLNHVLGIGVRTRGPIGIPGNFGGQRVKYTPLSVDLSTGVFTPPNDEYVDLVIMQMEVIIVEGEISALKRLSASSGPYTSLVGSAGNDGIRVTNADGVTIDVSVGRLQNRSLLARFDAETRRKELEMAINRFIGRISGNASKLIY